MLLQCQQKSLIFFYIPVFRHPTLLASVQSQAEKRQVARLHYSRKNWHDWYNLKIFQNGITLGCVYKWACSVLSVSKWSELLKRTEIFISIWLSYSKFFFRKYLPWIFQTSLLDPIQQIILHLDAIKWRCFNRQLTSWLITPVALQGPSLIYTF